MAETSTDWRNLAQLFERQTETLTDSDIKSILEMLDKADFEQLGDVTHAMCHAYEHGTMSNSACQKAGDIVLDKMIEKAEQSFYSHANRSIDGYWKSVKDNPELWDGLKSVLEKHPNYPFGQKYLGYMNGQTPEDESYVDNPNMLFVNTTMVDVDGTLLQNGNLNTNLIKSLATSDYTIYTGGNPEKQREILFKTAITGMMDLTPSLKEKYSVEDVVQAYTTENENSKLMRGYIFRETKLSGNDEASILRSFIGKLSKTMIIPKEAFVQDNICLAGKVFDDTQPQAQEIKSICPAILHPHEFIEGWGVDIPPERQISAEQAFEMWQQKQQQIESQRGHLQERQEYLAERKGEKVSSPTEPTTHDSNSSASTKPYGRDDGGR